MSRNSTSATGGAWAASSAAASTRKHASAESKAWLGAALQIVREGSAVAVQTLLSGLRADGHIIPAAEVDMVEDVERSTELRLDAEVDLGEVDDPVIEGWDETPPNLDGPAFVLGEFREESDESGVIESGFQIIVNEGDCRLHLPAWAGNEAKTEMGRWVVDELANRFIVLGQIAVWLSGSRKRFLASADPWHLGSDAYAEMRAGHVPVSPRSFLEMTGIGGLAKPEAFSRYTRDCFLVWPDATAPLSLLFDSRARRAWVGNFIRQAADAQGRVLSAVELDGLRNVTAPRARIEKERLLARSVDSLDFHSKLGRAALLADVGCSEVLTEYYTRIMFATYG